MKKRFLLSMALGLADIADQANVPKRVFSCLLTLILICMSGGEISGHTPENRVIYEVFVRNFSPEGNLKGVEKQIPRLKELGVDVVWLMPIYKLGDDGKWGTYSSPYAVKDYKAIDPDNGSEQDLRDLVKTIHDNGMEIWFDWVANHTSKDNVWTKSNPGFYGNNFYSPNGWNDVYQLDFSNSALHDAMIDAMQYWVSNFDIDGFRCDYASGPSSEFWSKATKRVLKNGERVAWLAEDDSKPELVSNGWFDYNYAWFFHDRLLDFARGGNVNTLRQDCLNLHNEAAYNGRSRMVYLSNHDVVQDKNGSEVVLFHKYVKPLTVLEFTIYGMPLIYNGQEIAYRTESVSLAEKTPIDWSKPDNGMTALIKKLCELKHTQAALNTGQNSSTLINHTASDEKVYVYERRVGEESVVVMLNFADQQKTFSISGNLPGFEGKDVFSGKTAKMSVGENFTLPAQGYAVYVKNADSPTQPVEPVEPVDPITPSADAKYLYILDETGWDTLYLYAWFDDSPELFGGWPGKEATNKEIVNGVEFKKIELPSNGIYPSNVIFNNNAGQQFDGPTLSAAEEMYVKINSASYEIIQKPQVVETPVVPANPTVSIYVKENTGWEHTFLYAYSNDKPSICGEWPGVELTEKVEKDGVVYKVLRDIEATAEEQTFILNNNAGDQIDIAGQYALDGDVYLNVEVGDVVEDTRNFIYIFNETGWNDVYLYAWFDNKAPLFGDWPGKKVADIEVIDNLPYARIELPANAEYPFNLIFNDNNGNQFDGPILENGKSVYFCIFEEQYVASAEPFEGLFNIYIEDKTGWDNLFLYAYRKDAPSLFGEWPGKRVDETEVIDGITYKVMRNVTRTSLEHNFIVNNNAGEQVDMEGLHSIDSHIFFTATSGIDMTENESMDIEYYNLQGIKIQNPGKGIYLCRKGGKIFKIVRK